MNEVEPFDEWEEFALFASHYFLLVAIKGRKDATRFGVHHKYSVSLSPGTPLEQINPPILSLIGCVSTEKFRNRDQERRFGSIYSVGREILVHHGGYGFQRRLSSVNVYIRESKDVAAPDSFMPPPGIGARMCHTITDVGDDRSLLVGGRTSPNDALSECWLRRGTRWERTDDLPVPLYRHCTARVLLRVNENGVLVFGGKSLKSIPTSNWFLWRESTGWVEIHSLETIISPRFGAVMEYTGPRCGLLLGGMTESGLICSDVWVWKLEQVSSRYEVRLRNLTSDIAKLPNGIQHNVYRFGACLKRSSAGLVLIGGIAKSGMIPTQLNILGMIQETATCINSDHLHLEPFLVKLDQDYSNLLLAGHSVGGGPSSLAIAGGGAVCFSFGTYWNQHIWSLQLDGAQNQNIWRCGGESDPEPIVTRQMALANLRALDREVVQEEQKHTMSILTTRLDSSVQAKRILMQSKPVVFDGLDLGPCTKEWTLESLKAKIGGDRPVRTHPSQYTIRH